MLLQLTLFCTIILSSTQKPLKAFLYGILPVSNEKDKDPEIQRLRSILNQKLAQHNINVEVEISRKNWTMLYSHDINHLLQIYDIVEFDLVAMPEIKVPLMNFTKQEVSYYQDMFEFQWKTNQKRVGGKEYFYSSPGFICDNFLLTRKEPNIKQKLYLYQSFSKYQAIDLYSELMINLGKASDLQDINYSDIDPQALQLLASFLTFSQDQQSKFNYQQSACEHPHPQIFESYFLENASTLMRYSEAIYKLFVYNPNFTAQDIQVNGTFDYNKKLIYLTQFTARQPDNDHDGVKKKTILEFYEFMVSDEVLDIYTKGLYTNHPRHTYLIPPRMSYFNRLRQKDSIYQQIYQVLIEDKQILINNSANYWKNIHPLHPKLKKALMEYSNRINHPQLQRHQL